MTGIERLLERRSDAQPAPGPTTSAVPAADVEPLRDTFAVLGDETSTATFAADGEGAEQVVATAVRTFATHDDEVVTTAATRGADGVTRHVITSLRDDGSTEVIRPATPVEPGEDAGWGTELAASDRLVAWNDGAAVHVLDRGTGRERVFEPGATGDVVTSIDVAGGGVVWSTARDGGTAVYLAADALGDGRPEVLAQGEGMVSVAIAGDLVAWQVEAADTGTAALHRARFE